MKRLLTTLGAVGLVLVAAGAAQAISLTDLLAGGSITAGDKVFDQWRVISETNTADLLWTLDTDNVTVTALNDGGLDPGPGLQFDILNDELSVSGNDLDPYQFIDYWFGFRVTAAPGYLIEDNTLTLLGASRTGIGDNGVYIDEYVATDPSLVDPDPFFPNPDLATKHVEFSYLDPAYGGPGGITSLTDAAAFAPHSQIYVSKNLFVWADLSNETAVLRGFSQRFSQTPIPEPSTWLLMGLGLVGLMGVGRKVAVRA